MSKDTIKQLKKDLEKLLEGKIEFYAVGICHNVSYGSRHFRDHFSTWKHYSGDINYPIPDPEGKLSAFDIYHRRKNLWEGEYGELRLNLVRHILQEIKIPSIKDRLIKWFKELL